MIKINNLRLKNTNNKIFSSKSYKDLNRLIAGVYIFFMLIYVFRDNLYKLDSSYITLFAEVAPNLIPSFLFTIIGMFYIVPLLKGINSVGKSRAIWLIDAINIIVFLLIEYIHVVFKLGSWDNNDIIASLIGIALATVIYFKTRNNFVKEYSK
ncbi:hypothetical protein SDC9_94054 [bioreactor metagenome]|uniref:VanZ-like domain-containing protein n=1 Tax=bioreactor metagenome TaxID=1076179 RepID=A0A645A2C9_9ZZZZ